MLRPSGSELTIDQWTEGIPTNNHRGRGSGPPMMSFGEVSSYSPTALLVRVQCFMKGLNKAVELPSTRSNVLSMNSVGHTFDVEGVKLFSSPTRRNSLRI